MYLVTTTRNLKQSYMLKYIYIVVLQQLYATNFN